MQTATISTTIPNEARERIAKLHGDYVTAKSMGDINKQEEVMADFFAIHDSLSTHQLQEEAIKIFI